MAGDTIKNDPNVVRQVLQVVEQQEQYMVDTQQRVTALMDEVNVHFKAAASEAYQSNMEAWIGKYKEVQAKYTAFHQQLKDAQAGIETGGEDATAVANSMYGSSSRSDYIASQL
ncbi:WXG100 family type VII secretion target [Kitasatospora sp. NPDC094015]|uniref:WXG100 family type VII secretion target n=1 Tax=Kitasatospora sp. NPDC094015 TaxID=3155205 RepID=UPI003322F1DD